MVDVNEREQVLWLARRAGFGLANGSKERPSSGPSAMLETLVDPSANGVPLAADPFAFIPLFDPEDDPARRASVNQFISAWLDHMVATPRQLEEMMTWFWHDHFAVQTAVVRSGRLMADHINLLRRHSLGNFRILIRQVTTDAAMLDYLDGASSTIRAPNENYGRELLELYTMGIGNYTEADVKAAAASLTGWQVRIRDGARVAFNARLHDARPQVLLGRTVSDVDSWSTPPSNTPPPRTTSPARWRVRSWAVMQPTAYRAASQRYSAKAISKFGPSCALCFRPASTEPAPRSYSRRWSGGSGYAGRRVRGPTPGPRPG